MTEQITKQESDILKVLGELNESVRDLISSQNAITKRIHNIEEALVAMRAPDKYSHIVRWPSRFPKD